MLVVAWSLAAAAAIAEERQQVTAMDGVTYGLMPKGIEWMNPGDTRQIGTACDSGTQTGLIMKTYQCTSIQQVVATEAGLVLEPGGSEVYALPNSDRLTVLIGIIMMALSMVLCIVRTYISSLEIFVGVCASVAAGMALFSALMILDAEGLVMTVLMVIVAGVVGFVPQYVFEKQKPHSVYWLAAIVYLGLMAAVFVQV